MTFGARVAASLLGVVALALLSAPPAWATDPADVTSPRVFVDVPVLDLPFNAAHGGRAPSMQQSLWVTADSYEILHTGLRYVADPYGERLGGRILGYLLLGTVDVFTVGLPPLLAWQHEEWHRAVMSNRGIGSFDDVYKLEIFSEVTAVSHVRDEDLIALKARHPAEQVRLSAAGIEGNQELVTALERISFFEGSRAPHTFLLPLLVLGNALYMDTCSSKKGDDLTDKLNAQDGADVPKRDFTGLDCTAWVYDLFTPDEPYTARGAHPSGVGINRYRKTSDLSPEARDYLSTQSQLSLVNFLDPRLIGFRRFVWGSADTATPIYWNAGIRHLPTSFGYAFRGDVYFMRGDLKLLASLYAYGNHEHLLPGLDLASLNFPFGRGLWTLSPRVAAWLQPQSQRFFAAAVTPGGLAAARLAYRARPSIEPWLELQVKSEGWVPGEVNLGPAFAVRTGLSARLF